jgi:uncharacterized protein (TIGR00299 family) protein
VKAPRRILFVDGSAGASGDMILGGLVDLGVPPAVLRRALASLPLEGWTLRARRTTRAGLAGRKVDVRVREGSHERNWRQLRRILERGKLAPRVRERSLAIFRRLIEAEARAHGTDPERVHLHEAGATDAIVDVVGACVGLEHLGVSRIRVSPLTTGFGALRCRHGVYPVPGPATLILVRDCPVRAGDIAAERLTPTGAAILTGVATEWGEMPALRVRAVGHGAGDLDLGDTPNLLRLVLGEETDQPLPAATGEIVVLECTVDDSTPQALAHAASQLLAAGALEVFTTGVTMKKGRAGHTLTALARPSHAADLGRLMLRETSSLGLRFRTERRIEMPRSTRRVATPYGSVRVTLGELDGEVVQAWPEYEDCAELARRRGVPLREIQHAALSARRDGPSRRRGRRP